jgi:quercetin dioxygenase-like cupin family protein
MEKSVLDCKFPSALFGGAALLLFLVSACATQPSPAPVSADSKLPLNGPQATPVARTQETEGSAAPAPAASADQPTSPAAGAPPNAQAPATTAPSSAGSAERAQEPKTAQGISRTLLDQSDLQDLPGWETRMYLIEYAPGVAAPPHHHPAAGVGYVVSGSFESTFEGGKASEVREGQSFRDLPNVSHVMFKNTSATKPLKFVISYVVRKGAPVLVVP